MSKPPVIAIVDDDEAVREALCDLLEVEGLSAQTFGSAADFLAGDMAKFGCLITDVRMPQIDGLSLQRRLRTQGSAMPVIFITSSSDEAARTSALRDGAFAWLTKPVADAVLLDALCAALGRGAAASGPRSGN